MSTSILIVDDEPRYLRLLETNLIVEGYEILKAINGQEAVTITAEKQPDLILLDIMMPVLDGFQACQRIREFSNVPIIIFTARGNENDRVRGLDLGADDYILKPFSANELLARVRAVLRRSQRPGVELIQSNFNHGNLRIDLARAEVYVDEKPAYLSATEYRLLLHFAHNLGVILSTEQLLSEVWGTEYIDEKEILWVSISRLRQKVETDARDPKHIMTKPGQGYWMPQL